MSTTWKILAKEILEARRDRSLLLHLIVVPLFMYPLLGFGAWQVFMIIQGASEGRENQVWVDAQLPSAVRDSLEQREDLDLLVAPAELLDAVKGEDAQAVRAFRAEHESLRVDAVVAYDASLDQESFWIAYDSSRERSESTRQVLEEPIEEYLETRRVTKAGELGLSALDLRPLDYEMEDTASKGQLARYVLSLLLPMLLVLMLPQGAYYTTLDTVVGERERGTFETLLSSAASRQQILTGKFLYITFSSLLTFTLNLLSLSLFLGFALNLMGLEGSAGFSLNPMDMVLILLAALLVAAFLAAAMMVVAVPCRNYREGQSALMPLFLVPALSGLVVATQGDSFPSWLALVPVINVAALVRESLLTALTLALAARVGRREDILFDANLTLRRLLRREERSSA